jgi:hypothetical protein
MGSSREAWFNVREALVGIDVAAELEVVGRLPAVLLLLMYLEMLRHLVLLVDYIVFMHVVTTPAWVAKDALRFIYRLQGDARRPRVRLASHDVVVARVAPSLVLDGLKLILRWC